MLLVFSVGSRVCSDILGGLDQGGLSMGFGVVVRRSGVFEEVFRLFIKAHPFIFGFLFLFFEHTLQSLEVIFFQPHL